MSRFSISVSRHGTETAADDGYQTSDSQSGRAYQTSDNTTARAYQTSDAEAARVHQTSDALPPAPASLHTQPFSPPEGVLSRGIAPLAD